MQLKHGHIEKDRYQDKTDSPREEVPRPHPWTDTKITQEKPQLQDRTNTNCRNCEETDPFAGYDSAQGKTSQSEPCPPLFGKRFFLVLVRKPHKEEDGEGREKYKGRIQ
jgi:hypothetical protein